MQNIISFIKKILTLKWYYQLSIALAGLVLIALLIRFLIWFVPILLAILALLFILTDGEIFTDIWNSYRKSKQEPTNPLFTNIYHWLTENVNDLPLNTKEYSQGIEWHSQTEAGVYYVHLKKRIDNDDLLSDFKRNLRQEITIRSNKKVDAIVNTVEQDPFLAIKIRLVPAVETLAKEQRFEEDF